MQSNKCPERLQGTVQIVESHQNSNDWPWGVTKRSIKVAIIATTARSYREVYIQPPQHQHKVHKKELEILVLSHCIAFIIWELPYTDFGIEDVVTGTTLVAILKKQPYQFYYQRDESLAPSGRIHFDWRICTSSMNM